MYEQDSKTWALFTNNSIRFTDALELTLGVRYTDESKDLDSHYVNQHGGAGCQALRNNSPAISAGPAARLQRSRRSTASAAATFADPIFNNLATAQTLDEERVERHGEARVPLHR